MINKEKNKDSLPSGVVHTSASADISDTEIFSCSPADEVFLIDRIVQRALKDFGIDDKPLQEQLILTDVVEASFPVHDKQFNKRFLKEYVK